MAFCFTSRDCPNTSRSSNNQPTVIIARSKIGACHLCGKYGPLSEEHVPPQAAFNRGPTRQILFEDSLRFGPDAPANGIELPNGLSGFTLCAKCNQKTGRIYGAAFADWCFEGVEILHKSGGVPKTLYLRNIYPLKVIKQVVTMFASVCGSDFSSRFPGLAEFVLTKYEKGLNDRYRIYCFLNPSSRYRYCGIGGILKPLEGKYHIFSEMCFPPFGYILTDRSTPPDSTLTDITGFACYDLKIKRTIELPIVVKYSSSHLPGDYRSADELRQAFAENTREAQQIQWTDDEMKRATEGLKSLLNDIESGGEVDVPIEGKQ